MATTDPIAKIYAESLFILAQSEKCVERVDDELESLKKVFEQNLKLLAFLQNDNINADGKKKALIELFGEDISQLTLNYVALIVNMKRLNILASFIDAFSGLIRSKRKVSTVYVTTAIPMDKTMEEDLESKLKKMVGGDVYIKKSVDESIIGGLIIRLGDKFLDGSIKGQLGKVRSTLVRSYS